MAFCGSLTASSSRTVWTWTQRGWSVWQRTGRRSSRGERSKCSPFISAIAIVLLLNIIIIESILDNHNSKAEYFPCSRMKKIADGLIHYRRSSESSSITSSSAGSVGLFTLIKYFLDDAKKSINSHESIKSRNEYTYIRPFSFQVEFFQFNYTTPTTMETLLKFLLANLKTF